MASDSDIEEYRRVIAELLTLSPSDDIKQVLKIYNPRLPTNIILKNLSVIHKDKLREAVNFLSGKDLATAKIDELFTLLKENIKNLFSKNCAICDIEYRIKMSDSPILKCVKFNECCHKVCMEPYTLDNRYYI